VFILVETIAKFFLTILWVFHAYLLYTKQSTYDFIVNRRERKEKRDSKISPSIEENKEKDNTPKIQQMMQGDHENNFERNSQREFEVKCADRSSMKLM